MNWPNGKIPRVLLVDDDPVFALLMENHARFRGAVMKACSDEEGMKQALSNEPFDVVILDYYLGNRLGTELAAMAGPKTPVVLVSHTGAWLRDCEEWPSNIAKFVHKNQGVDLIFETAVNALRHDRPHIDSGSSTERPYF